MSYESNIRSSRQLGVLYRPEDYVGLARRLLIETVDVVVAIVLVVIMTTAIVMMLPTGETEKEYMRQFGLAFFASALIAWVGYFIVLKSTGYRTLGYKIANARLVTIDGQQPGLLCLAFRALFAVLGPLNFLLDLMWIGSDDCRQALRDKVAHTYVVRFGAEPKGFGPIVFRPYTISGTSWIFREVSASSREEAR